MEEQLRQAAQTAVVSWQNEEASCALVHPKCGFWVVSTKDATGQSFQQATRPSGFLPSKAPVTTPSVKVLSHGLAAAVLVRIGDTYTGFIVFLQEGSAEGSWKAISVCLSPYDATEPVLPTHFDAVTALTWKGYCHASRQCDGKLMAEYFHDKCRLTYTDTSKQEIAIIDAPTFYSKVEHRYTSQELSPMHIPYAHLQHDHALIGQFDTLISVDFASPTVALVVLKVGHPPCLWTDLLTCACDRNTGRWWIVHKSSEMDLYLQEHAQKNSEQEGS
jgi:hypothetical protein